MNNRKIILILGVVSLITFLMSSNLSAMSAKSNKIKNERGPLMECVTCLYGAEGWTRASDCLSYHKDSDKCLEKSWGEESCCSPDFQQECLVSDGVIRFSDLHPGFPGFLYRCLPKSVDAGKRCARDSDCSSGSCELVSAIETKECALIKKEQSSQHQTNDREEFYKATYRCKMNKPGVCAEAPPHRTNPGGMTRSFRMEKNILIETKEPGPIM